MHHHEPIKLGERPKSGQQRDAIHVAILPAVASTRLYPGQHVGLLPDGLAGPSEKSIGIVDPFLMGVTSPGESFYICLYPQTVTGMRHNWSHPEVIDDDLRMPPRRISELSWYEYNPNYESDINHSESKKWLENFAASHDVDYDVLMERIEQMVNDGNIGCNFDLDGEDIPNELWDHYQIVIGSVVKEKPTSFMCSC